ncbi:MAG TPA: rhodanese-like domain-containing protein [Candidatus Acidoferrales bacterium]|nr:rhodanese-like domain-containing protein [Candidatus Acidoferrales bacterium]
MSRRKRTFALTAGLLAGGSLVLLASGAPAPQEGRGAAQGEAAVAAREFEHAARVEPKDLAKGVEGPKARAPVIVQVGFEVLYRSGHIPGAIYAGPASRPEGLAALRRAVAAIPRDREVVIYCGCCPMDKCPNIRPAYHALHQMGFRRLEVLDLPDDFAHDWAVKHLPVVPPRAP